MFTLESLGMFTLDLLGVFTLDLLGVFTLDSLGVFTLHSLGISARRYDTLQANTAVASLVDDDPGSRLNLLEVT
jgi:hypothetical protein